MLVVSRLMLRAEKCDLRMKLINVIMSTIEIAYLRLFIDYHGLQIIWSWMVEAENIELKARLLELLEILPIQNKTMLIDSKVYSIVERWAHKDSIENRQFLNYSDDYLEKNVSKHDSYDNKTEELKTDIICPDKDIISDSLIVSSDNNNNNNNNNNENDDEKRPISDVNKFSSKIVIKSKSKSNIETLTPKKTIGYFAQKLLSHWKELKEVFRIPRLERQKRHDDEVEADRRTKEEEERRAHGLPVTVLPNKRIDDDRDYTIAGILGNKRRCLKKLTDSSTDYRNDKPQFLINTNASINTNRLSKEKHRKMFEYNIAQNDYAEALRMYHEDLALYSATLRCQMMQQLQAMQQNDFNFNPSVSDIYQHSTDSATNFPDASYSNSFSNFKISSGHQFINPPINLTTKEDSSKQNHQFIPNSESNDDYLELSLKDIVPKYSNPLITLSTNLSEQSHNSSYAIDNVDFSQVRYDSDDLIESMEKKMFDEIYPPEGIFYVTPKGDTYFTSLSGNVSQPINVKENVTEPLSLAFTKRPPEDLPYNWKCNNLDGHVYYFNKRRHIKQWYPPQDGQIDTFDGNQQMDMSDVHNEIIQSNSNSPIRNRKFALDKDKDLDSWHEGHSIDLKRKTKKIQEQFRNKVSPFIVKCLNPFLRNDCTSGRITNNDDFKYLARKVCFFFHFFLTFCTI